MALIALACAGVLGLTAVSVAVALAASGGAAAAILAECASGAIAGHFAVHQLENALAIMPAATKQYTSRPDVIQAAINDPQHRHGGTALGTGAGSSFLPTPVVAVLVVLILVSVTMGALQVRRRRDG